MPTIDFPKESFILYPNYFGVCENNVDKLVKIYPNIIIDNAHSYYSKPKGLASFNAKHKFFEKTGSTLWLSTDDFELEADNNRVERFWELHERFKSQNLLKFENIICPFCYPLLVSTDKAADEIANEFIKRDNYL